ncbi:uncharacterized protein LOC110600883 [Manihot esculenta]|uniref:Uncharacterized protein n=1 Tax=Manihot esculenta TaxID=3983 RepID=A0A2C9UEG0_MANES|nr:uncharacterized protein LOC110600883 [Manihot esculenta]OAY28714.1 hypothetical protein MANES_15G088900v8 [Manihot esculenta]
MEHHHQKTTSRDIFSDQDSDFQFEFGCFTPDSPSTDPFKASPADHLFYNGRLLPHSFPVQTPTTTTLLVDSISRASSRNSSVSSKGSLVSSRSNSVNSSRSSVSSSSRTSWSSDYSQRRLLYHSTKLASRTPMASKVVMAQFYGSSQRWQHIVSVPPAMKREDSRRKNVGVAVVNPGLMNKKDSDHQKEKKGKSLGICRKIFRSFLVACRECHAIEPSREEDILQGNVKLQ